jgi:hypothetical protein
MILCNVQYLNEVRVHGFYEPLLIKIWVDDGRGLASATENASGLDDHLKFLVPRECSNVVNDALKQKCRQDLEKVLNKQITQVLDIN